MTKKRVLILFGGRSAEHEVSVISARSVCRALDRDRYVPVLVGIDGDGNWLFGGGDEAILLTKCVTSIQSALVRLGNRPGELVARDGADVESGRFDVVFPLLHGPYGEDGTVQGLLELAGVPYVGAAVAASAVGMDKELARAIFSAAGLPQTRFVVIRRSRWRNNPSLVIQEVERDFDYPLFIKPVNLGSSVGISKAHDRDEMIRGIDGAGVYATKILIEVSVEQAREIECAVLGEEDPEVSGVGEIVPGAEFYDYQTKYIDDCATLIIPADLPGATVKQIQEMSICAFRAIDCSGLARVDFLIGQDGEILLNEINTMPGFTPISMYPKLWAAAGLNYPDLIDRLIQISLARHSRRRDLKTTL